MWIKISLSICLNYSSVSTTHAAKIVKRRMVQLSLFLSQWILVSISSTFYVQLLRVGSMSVKAVCWTLMKLSLGVNFINILHTHFAPIFWHQKISNPKHSFVIFVAKISAQNVCLKCWWNRLVVYEQCFFQLVFGNFDRMAVKAALS